MDVIVGERSVLPRSVDNAVGAHCAPLRLHICK